MGRNLAILVILLFIGRSIKVMAVTIKTAPHSAIKFKEYYGETLSNDANGFFNQTQSFQRAATNVLGSSFDPTQRIYYTPNGFVNTVLRAYNAHQNLVIRPDDVWIAIVSQLSFYINGNAEELRSKFVTHDGKKELLLFIPITPLDKIDWDSAGDRMTNLIDQNLVDKEFKEWVLPKFTTTTRVDKTVSAMLMMSSMKAYFSYKMEMLCGIPQVTLDGNKEDWMEIASRLEKLDTWDDKTKDWKRLLLPIITRFIKAYEGEIDTDFWSHIIHSQSYGSGSASIYGWITAFTIFTEQGSYMGDSNERGLFYSQHPYVLDEVKYPQIKLNDVAVGSAEVDVLIVDGAGVEWKTMLIMGNMGMKVTREDTVQNVPMWACCLKKGEKEKAENEKSWFLNQGWY